MQFEGRPCAEDHQGSSSGGQELKLKALSFILNCFMQFLDPAPEVGCWRVKYAQRSSRSP